MLYFLNSINSPTKYDIQMKSQTKANNNMRVCKTIPIEEIGLDQGQTYKYGTGFTKHSSD
jgi:hypothetical protein